MPKASTCLMFLVLPRFQSPWRFGYQRCVQPYGACRSCRRTMLTFRGLAVQGNTPISEAIFGFIDRLQSKSCGYRRSFFLSLRRSFRLSHIARRDLHLTVVYRRNPFLDILIAAHAPNDVWIKQIRQHSAVPVSVFVVGFVEDASCHHCGKPAFHRRRRKGLPGFGYARASSIAAALGFASRSRIFQYLITGKARRERRDPVGQDVGAFLRKILATSACYRPFACLQQFHPAPERAMSVLRISTAITPIVATFAASGRRENSL